VYRFPNAQGESVASLKSIIQKGAFYFDWGDLDDPEAAADPHFRNSG
jgi:hypothetical protein